MHHLLELLYALFNMLLLFASYTTYIFSQHTDYDDVMHYRESFMSVMDEIQDWLLMRDVNLTIKCPIFNTISYTQIKTVW